MKKVFWLVPIVLTLGWSVRAQEGAKVVDRIVAQVNDDIITLSDMKREMDQVREGLAQRYSGAQLDQEVEKARKDVLGQLIDQKLLLQKATELGFGANVDIQVSAYVERIRKDNNIPDMQTFEKALQQQGFTMASYREYLRKQIIIQSLVNEMVGSRITLLSQEIEKYYKDHAKDFTTPEEVTLSEIIIPIEGNAAEAKARTEEIHQRIARGESFASLASQYSKGPTAGKGGGIGSYVTGKLNSEIADVVTSVKAGDVTPVMKGKDSFAIYRVDSRKPAVTKPLEEVRNDIKNRIYQEKYQPEYARFVAQLKEEAYIQIFDESPTQ